jgi:hypothetical protein
MRIREITNEPAGDGTRELSATMDYGMDSPESLRIWFRRPDWGAGPEGVADPLLTATFVFAMALGEDLEVHGPVSSDLLDHISKAYMSTLLKWYPRLSNIVIKPDRVVSPAEPAPDAEVGALFSGGVDSWYTLRNCGPEIHQLVHINGLDVETDDERAWNLAHREVLRTADQHGKPVIAVESNIFKEGAKGVRHRLKREARPWKTFLIDAYYGSFLSSIGLVLRPRLRRLIIPSSHREALPYPIGSHPELEPTLSTDSLSLELNGFDASRLDKIRALHESTPSAFDRIRVCVRSSDDMGDFLNCGRCRKCVRTMLEIDACGVPIPEATFRYTVDLEFAKRYVYAGDTEIWRDLRRYALATGNGEVADTVSVVLDEKFHFPRLVADLARLARKRSLKARRAHWPWRSRSGRPAKGAVDD